MLKHEKSKCKDNINNRHAAWHDWKKKDVGRMATVYNMMNLI